MPYKSEAQRKFMHARHPKIAKRWDKEYSSQGKLPEKLHPEKKVEYKKKMKKTSALRIRFLSKDDLKRLNELSAKHRMRSKYFGAGLLGGIGGTLLVKKMRNKKMKKEGATEPKNVPLTKSEIKAIKDYQKHRNLTAAYSAYSALGGLLGGVALPGKYLSRGAAGAGLAGLFASYGSDQRARKRLINKLRKRRGINNQDGQN